MDQQEQPMNPHMISSLLALLSLFYLYYFYYLEKDSHTVPVVFKQVTIAAGEDFGFEWHNDEVSEVHTRTPLCIRTQQHGREVPNAGKTQGRSNSRSGKITLFASETQGKLENCCLFRRELIARLNILITASIG